MKLISQASLKILKPIEEVFEGIVNPDHMCQYFISESSGRLETGNEVFWKFPEFDERFPITKVQIKLNDSISYVWDPETIVEIKLESYSDSSTIVKVTEGAKDQNEENLKWLVSNTGGWANFLACLKAYLEYDIQLRKGAFDFMQNQ